MRKINLKFLLSVTVVLLALVFVRTRDTEVLKTCIDKKANENRDGTVLTWFIIWRNEEDGVITSSMVSPQDYYSTHVGRQYRVRDWELYIKKY